MSDKRLYRVINHACRQCGGRLLMSKPDRLGSLWYRCADCGVSAMTPERKDGLGGYFAAGYRALCFCGAKTPGVVKLRCAVNHSRGLEMPEEIVVTSADGGADQKSAVVTASSRA